MQQIYVKKITSFGVSSMAYNFSNSDDIVGNRAKSITYKNTMWKLPFLTNPIPSYLGNQNVYFVLVLSDCSSRTSGPK